MEVQTPATEAVAPAPRRNFAMIALATLLFLMPLFFIASPAGIAYAKTALFAVLVVLLFAFVMAREMRSGALEIPTNLMVYGVLLIPIVYLISALSASSLTISLLGQGFETDTVLVVFLLSLTLLLSYFACRDRGGAVYVLVATLASFGVLALFHLVRLLFGADVLSFGLFNTQTGSPIGKWNDLGIFVGLITLLSLLAVEFLTLRGIFRYVVWGAGLLALFFLMVVNFLPVWTVLATVALALIVVPLIRRPSVAALEQEWGGGGRRLRYYSLGVLIISLIFILDTYSPILFEIPQPPLGSAIANTFSITQLEARPSWQTTFELLGATYRDTALLGSGPNTFSEVWLMHKPLNINETLFWNTPFSSAIGYVPTSAVTTGILGILAWLFFLGSYLYLGVRALRRLPSDRLNRYLVLTTFILSAYLWFFSIIYVPSLALLVLAAALSGIFLSLLYQEGLLVPRRLSLSEHPRIGYAISLLLVIFFILSLAGTFSVSRSFFASLSFGKSVSLLNVGDLDSAGSAIARAIALSDVDRYRQLAAQIDMNRVAFDLADNQNPGPSKLEELRTLAQRAVEHALAATTYNRNNYYNWMTLGQVYESLARLGATGAYENALTAYGEAESLNPATPAVSLARARLEATNGNFNEARTLAEQALTQKTNYTAAAIFLAQVEIATGNTARAIPQLRTAARSAPGNALILFQLGFLEYSERNIPGAIEALELATKVDENYSNARYFLGLSYVDQGRIAEAIEQFERIQELNPDNQEVTQILSNLKAGKDPLGNTIPPEVRREPPVDE